MTRTIFAALALASMTGTAFADIGRGWNSPDQQRLRAAENAIKRSFQKGGIRAHALNKPGLSAGLIAQVRAQAAVNNMGAGTFRMYHPGISPQAWIMQQSNRAFQSATAMGAFRR